MVASSLSAGPAVRSSWMDVTLPCGARIVKEEDGVPSRLSDEGLWVWLLATAEDEAREDMRRLTGAAELPPDGIGPDAREQVRAAYDAFERRALEEVQTLTGYALDYESHFNSPFGTRSLLQFADVSWRYYRPEEEDEAPTGVLQEMDRLAAEVLCSHLRRASEGLADAVSALNDAHAVSLGAPNFAWVQTQARALEELRFALRVEVEDARVSPLPMGAPVAPEPRPAWRERLLRAWAALRGR